VPPWTTLPSVTHTSRLPRHEKRKKALNEGHNNARHVPAAEVPRIAAMLAAFFYRSKLYEPEYASLDPLPCNRLRAMDSRYPLGVALDYLHGS